jgi:hypothetical protein
VIHLSRHISSWLRSGATPGSKGVPRPIELGYLNNFRDDFVRYLWMETTNRELRIPGKKPLDLSTATRAELAANRLYLESLHWCAGQRRGLRLRKTAAHYLHVRYEDLVGCPEETLEKLAGFINLPLVCKRQVETARANVSDVPDGVAPEVDVVMQQLGYS